MNIGSSKFITPKHATKMGQVETSVVVDQTLMDTPPVPDEQQCSSFSMSEDSFIGDPFWTLLGGFPQPSAHTCKFCNSIARSCWLEVGTVSTYLVFTCRDSLTDVPVGAKRPAQIHMDPISGQYVVDRWEKPIDYNSDDFEW